MAVNHSTNARDVATNAVTALLNASGAGKLVFRTAGNITVPGTAVATLTFSATAFGSSSSGTATANAITSDTNAAGGTVATATLQTGAAVVVIHCAVAGSGSDINLTGGLGVTAGDTVSCSSLTYTALSQ